MYSLWLRHRDRRWVVGWVAGEDGGDDRVVTEAGRLRVFADIAGLAGVVTAGGATVVEDETVRVYDLTRVQTWANSASTHVECSTLLDMWNLAEDIGRSVGKDFDATGRRASRIYDKLFWGCNLPVVTPPGREYVPLWSPAELAKLRRIMREATGTITRALDRAIR